MKNKNTFLERLLEKQRQYLRAGKGDLPVVKYNFLKQVEGGPGAKFILWRLNQEGLLCRIGYSSYIGHSAVEVFGTKKEQEKARKIIYGRGL